MAKFNGSFKSGEKARKNMKISFYIKVNNFEDSNPYLYPNDIHIEFCKTFFGV